MWWWFVLAGLAGGLIGGMGMGGGTLLIPILTIILGIDQHLAQGLNLIVFIPTGIIALVIHMINKLVDFKMFFIMIIPAVASAVGFAYLASALQGEILRKIFAGFLLAVGIFELIIAFKRLKGGGNGRKLPNLCSLDPKGKYKWY